MDENDKDGLEIPNAMITLYDRIQDTAPIISSSPGTKWPHYEPFHQNCLLPTFFQLKLDT